MIVKIRNVGSDDLSDDDEDIPTEIEPAQPESSEGENKHVYPERAESELTYWPSILGPNSQ